MFVSQVIDEGFNQVELPLYERGNLTTLREGLFVCLFFYFKIKPEVASRSNRYYLPRAPFPHAVENITHLSLR